MKRNKTRLQALKGSIRKWKLIVDGKAAEKGIANCPLCKKYWRSGCYNCPVSKKVDDEGCKGTPYGNWIMVTSSASVHKVVNKITRDAAKDELAFLKSLLPKK